MNAHVDQGRLPRARRSATPASPLSQKTRPASGSPWWLVPALLALAALPLIFGVLRLLQLSGIADIMPPETRFLASPVPLVIHIVAATTFALLGPFQFLPGIRRRWPRWHRLAGRVLVAAGLLAALSGLWMTLTYARAEGTGDLLFAFRLLFGSAMTVSIVLGLAAIIGRNVNRHRAWMLRAYAIGMGAGTQVLTGMVGEMLMIPSSELSRDLLMGAGWIINLFVAEWVAARPVARRSRAAA